MKLILEAAYEYLDEKGQATLTEMFNAIREEQKVNWKEKFPGKLMKQIEEIKLGELFTYLTTDGRFVMIDDKHWILTKKVSFTKAKRLRVNIGENKE